MNNLFIYWDKETNNYTDYHTKHHAPTHHINSREKHVLKSFHVYTIGFTHNVYPLYSPFRQKLLQNWWKFENISIYSKYILLKKYFWHVFNHVSIHIFQFFCYYDSIQNIFNAVVYKDVYKSGYRYLTYISYIYYYRK